MNLRHRPFWPNERTSASRSYRPGRPANNPRAWRVLGDGASWSAGPPLIASSIAPITFPYTHPVRGDGRRMRLLRRGGAPPARNAHGGGRDGSWHRSAGRGRPVLGAVPAAPAPADRVA